MGVCLSCLGLEPPAHTEEPSEADRLLYSPTANPAYGTAHPAPPADPEELRRRRENLERICADAANDLLDVQHTQLRGRPSAEFARLLNAHFTTEDAKPPQEPEQNGTVAEREPPKTPVAAAVVVSPTEPPSPFTRAQMAARSGRPVGGGFATIAETADGEGEEEEAWLRGVGWSGDEGVKRPGTRLVVELGEEAK